MFNSKQFKILYKKRSEFQLTILYTIECKMCGYILIILEKIINDKKNILVCPNCHNEI